MSFRPRTPFEALESLLWVPHMMYAKKLRGPGTKPGEIVEMMPEATRKLLRKLTAKDLDVRPDEVALWIERQT